MLQRQRLERNFFRALNSVVEPAVRRGLGSPRLTPSTLIVLESTGYKSGRQRRTPLVALRLGRRLLVSTARGERSFWVKNLNSQPTVNYSLAGNVVESEAILISPEFNNLEDWDLSTPLARLTRELTRYAERGWAFALLVPAEQ